MIARLAINAQIIILQVAKIEIRYLLFWLLAVVGKILLSLFPKGFVLLLVDESLFPKGLSPSRLLLFVDSVRKDSIVKMFTICEYMAGL